MHIRIEGLYKSFGDHHVLRDLSLEFEQNVIGLLAPNGAGKTTFIRILTGLLAPDAGKIIVNGARIQSSTARLAYKSQMGYLPQTFGVPPRITGIEFLRFLCRLFFSSQKQAERRIMELLELVNLVEYRNKRLSEYSGGMKRRFGIAQALLNDPQLLIVDEPTAGLDPEERITFRNILSELPANRSIILSTHIVEDIEITCTRLIMLELGKVGFDATPTSLFTLMMPFIWEAPVSSDQLDTYSGKPDTLSVHSEGEYYIVRRVARTQPIGFQPSRPTFEDVYLAWLHRSDHGIRI